MSQAKPEQDYFEAHFTSWLEACHGAENENPASKKEELRLEAKNLFRSYATSEENPDPAFLETSLAKLLNVLGPGLTGSWKSRICSLSVFCGAVEGCRGFLPISVATTTLISQFLLGQCGPMEEENGNFGDDYAEQIRDLAIQCLSALLKCPLPADEEAYKLLCTVSKQGVERRCALPLEDEDARHFSGVTGGLSTLPRSRRSNCFDLLQSAVDGIQSLVEQQKEEQLAKMAKTVESDATTFIRFACNCLQGESDPRCLMQLLVLFHNIQVAFQPLFDAGKLTSFPTVNMFDAVAPYYPINFTPPPHDNHGITRAGLKGALMSVLAHHSYDRLAAAKNQDTMLSLGLGLVLERLIPMDGDTSNLAVNAVEKKEALDDMELILLNDSALELLPKGSAQQLSNALIVTHQDAAVAVTMGGTDAQDNKKLADACRCLIAEIAYKLESVKDKSLWNDFVRDPVQDMISQLESAASGGRIAIAYLASLVASGGPQTTRFVLEAGLEKSIRVLKQYQTDEEVATMAAYGIGAFFSSCHVAMDKAHQAGLQLHPHPVAKMSSSTFQMLYKVFTDPETKESYSLRNAAVVALESVLIVSPADQFDEADQKLIGEFVAQLASDVLEATDKSESVLEDASKLNLVLASSNALGGLMGKAIQSDSETAGSNNNSIVQSKKVQDVLKIAMVDLLFRSKQGSPADASARFDRIALARACTTGLAAATIIIESLLLTLRDALADHSVTESLDGAIALSYVLKNGGDVAARAFHELPTTGVTSRDVIDKLCALDPRRERRKDSEKNKKITALDLPATVEELQKAQKVRQEIASLLLPAYKSWVPTKEIMKSMAAVARIMPPLSNQDVIRLAVMLPLLAESLENGNLPPRDKLGESKAALDAGNDLASYALNSDYEASSRSAAASCLSSFIVHLTKHDEKECPAKKLLEDIVMPTLLDATKDLAATATKGQKDKEGCAARDKVVDCLQLSSVMVSAAASRGSISVTTADTVAVFLVQVACTRKAEIPFVKAGEIDLTAIDQGENTTTSAVIATSAAAAFGSLLCSKRPLWTQRLTHKTLKLLEPTLKQALEGKMKPTADSLSFIAVLCHLVCSGSLKSASLSKRGEVVQIIVESLVSGVLISEDSLRIPHELSQVKCLVIASILKLSQTSPGLLSSQTERLVIGLMRVYASAADSNPFSDMPCKLLILQVMERLCHMEIRKKVLHAIKPAITSILAAAMNHPSRLLREAAVTVQNTWFTLPE